MNKRRVSKQIKIGDVAVGGGAPVVVQSMTKTDTRDAKATLRQIKQLEETGCEIVRVAVARTHWLYPQEEESLPMTDAALVIGGGVAGIQAALDLADAGHKVYLVEKEPSIGGIMARLDKTYPTMDCSI